VCSRKGKYLVKVTLTDVRVSVCAQLHRGNEMMGADVVVVVTVRVHTYYISKSNSAGSGC